MCDSEPVVTRHRSRLTAAGSGMSSRRGRDPRLRARCWISGLVLGLFLGAAGYLFAFDPAREGTYPICLFRRFTGLYCAGCGTARALHQLLHGRVLAALDLNPLLILALPVLAWMGIPRWVDWLRGRPRPPRRIGGAWVLGIIIVVLLYTVARNIPVWPFILLAP